MKKLKVPEEVLRKIERIESLRVQSDLARMRAENREREERAKLAEERARRFEELNTYAQFLFDWRDALRKNRKVWNRIWKTSEYGTLTLYVGHYWKGRSCPNSTTTCAVLMLDQETYNSSIPIFRYEERCKGWTNESSRTFARSPNGLIRKTPPDFLKDATGHLKGPDAWKYILLDLNRYLPPSDRA